MAIIVPCPASQLRMAGALVSLPSIVICSGTLKTCDRITETPLCDRKSGTGNPPPTAHVPVLALPLDRLDKIEAQPAIPLTAAGALPAANPHVR